jgi:hypothetical protein
VGLAVVHRACDVVRLEPVAAFVSRLRGPANHSRKRITATLKSWTTSAIGGESALGGRQETFTRVVVDAIDDLQRIEQASIYG